MTADPQRFRVAIVGTGPAGFYAAQSLQRLRDFPVSIDLFERLPTPFGLVRAGVAPDHAHIKAVARTFTRTMERAEQARFFGNVQVGRDLTVAELEARYDAVVWAVGAEGGRRLSVPGCSLDGVELACRFVYWVNGHPDHADLALDLDRVRRVMVVGNGNVALDVARVLGRPAAAFAQTDASDRALAALRDSAVTDIDIVGRRGPAEASFTEPELREIADLDGVDFSVEAGPFGRGRARAALDRGDALAADQRRMLERMSEAAGGRDARRRIRARFLLSPVAFDGDGRVQRVQLERNRLEARGDRLAAVPTGERWWEPIDLVLVAIGYHGPGVPGLPYDERRGTLPSTGGRLTRAPGGDPVPRHYVTGWARRGPSGVVGTNRPDAKQVVAALWDDLHTRRPGSRVDDVADLLAERGVRWVGWPDWQRLDAVEVEAGAAAGRPRVKRVDWPTLLAAASGAGGD
jgi:ferredoxin--NADP+ reductase